MLDKEIYLGTAGWSYKDWIHSFYNKAQSDDYNWLQFYSNYFNVVEVNATYYTYLNPVIIKNWIRKTDDVNFIFTIKLHQDFTHKRKYTSDNIRSMRYNADLLKESNKLGGILMQFPYSFFNTSTNTEYIHKLIKHYEDYPLFIEVRHKSWFNNDVYKNFKKLNVSWCVLDQPQIDKSVPFKILATNSTAYIRFHGRNEEAWIQSISKYDSKQTNDQQNARYEYLYSPGELVEIEQQIREVFDKVKKIFVIMNNHPKGNAIANAFELLYLLKDRLKINIPSTTVKSYPRLSEIGIDKIRNQLTS